MAIEDSALWVRAHILKVMVVISRQKNTTHTHRELGECVPIPGLTNGRIESRHLSSSCKSVRTANTNLNGFLKRVDKIERSPDSAPE
jgi:hypothetical protein